MSSVSDRREYFKIYRRKRRALDGRMRIECNEFKDKYERLLTEASSLLQKNDDLTRWLTTAEAEVERLEKELDEARGVIEKLLKQPSEPRRSKRLNKN